MPRTPKTPSVQTAIDRMVRRIVRRFRPEQVILFGSQAPATPGRTATWTCSS